MEAKHIVIFDLPAVVRYDHLPLRKALISAIGEVLDCNPVVTDIDWSRNVTGVVFQIYEHTGLKFPGIVEVNHIEKKFHSNLKEYFLTHDDPFDVWSGVQNIFKSLDKRPDWDYMIISDYWRKPTKFILNSCGIYSKKLNLLCAEYGKSSGEIISDLTKHQERIGSEMIFLLAKEIKSLKDIERLDKLKLITPPHKKKADLVEYPRFAKLFASGIESS